MDRIVIALLACGLAGGCSQAISQSAVQDAHTAARVKTALVNDATLGVRPIEVTVARGIVGLSGRVGSEAEARRAVELARSVDGVREVQSDLRIEGASLMEEPLGDQRAERPAREPESLEAEADETDRRLIAVGASVGRSSPRGRGLESATKLSPLVRLGSSSGFGLSIELSWFDANLSPSPAPGSLGRVHIRPVMAGVGYTLRGSRVSASLSLTGGVAFNSLSRQDSSAGPAWALDVDNSFAWRPGASVWLELTRRTAFNVSAGYVVTRPHITLVENGQTQTRVLRGDAALLNVGLVYKLF